MPVAVGFTKPGATQEDAYRSMLSYVGGYISDDTRYQMYVNATSKTTGVFKYNDAGLVDLTRGLQESVAHIDENILAHLPEKVELAQIAAIGADPWEVQSMLGEAFDVERLRADQYLHDKLAPARLHEEAVDRLRWKIAGVVLDVASVLPWGRLGRVAEGMLGALDRVGGLILGRFGRLMPKAGELLASDALGAIPGKGFLANRKQLRAFYDEAASMGVEVKIGDSASFSPRTKVVTIRPAVSESGVAIEGKYELSTLLDEYSHMWNTANGRGTFLPEDLAALHRSMGGKGTAGFTDTENTLFHQLELANMWRSGADRLPSFVRAVPRADIRSFINQTRDVARILGKL